MATAPKKIIDLISSFKTTNKCDPSRLYVSADDAAEWEKIPPANFGDPLAKEINVKGIRGALPRFHGIPVTWDAPKTKVE